MRFHYIVYCRHQYNRTLPRYAVLDKDTINKEIMPYLPVAKRGYVSRFDLADMVNAILYKLKTGCQWASLPVLHLFEGKSPSYKTVFHHYRKWCRSGEWERLFSMLVRKYRSHLDLSLSHIDGSHTPALRGGECVAYQGRKKRKTTNAIYLSDRQGLPLAMSEPQEGNHADLHDIRKRLDEIAVQLGGCGLRTDGLFCNADAGFDAKAFRVGLGTHGIIANVCPNPRGGTASEGYLFDEEMYKERYVIERTNAWIDSFRSLLTRFDTTVSSWKGWNYIAFAVIFLKKIHKSKKFR